VLGVVLLALGSAFCYGVASVLQHQAAEHQGEELAMKAGLFVRLVKSPRWMLGNVGDIVGFVLQVLALRKGPVVLVEPLLVTALVFAFPVAAAVRHKPIPRAEPVAAAVVTGGLALFLVVAQPEAGRDHVPSWELMALVAATGLVVGVLVLMTRVVDRRRAGLLLAVAGGVAFGTEAASVSITWQAIHQGLLHSLTTFGPYAVVLTGAAGIVLTNAAFSAGVLRLTLPTLTVVQPLVAIGIGVGFLTEKVSTAGLDVLWEALGLIVMVVGVYALAQPEFPD
jgi:drug/metabolite transporter (DMT)-like permease